MINGQPHSAKGDAPEIVKECARRLPSRFYSVDVIRRSDGQLRIVEVGDGQVSDLVGWNVDRFADLLAKSFRHTFQGHRILTPTISQADIANEMFGQK